MVVNDNAASLTPRSVCESFASKLAPTEGSRRLSILQAQKSRLKAAFLRKRRAGYRPDISLMAPLSSSSEQSAQVPLGGIALTPVMALARMPSRPPW